MTNKKRALVLVDVQNDFCPGGSLATERGAEIAGEIAAFLGSEVAELNNYAYVLATQDWHIDPGSHFSDTPDFVDSWPVHCVADSEGAALHPALAGADIDEFFRKGENSAAYSGFEAALAGTDNADADQGAPLLADWLRDNGVEALDVCGIATDHCVRATALDGLSEGFEVRVLSGLCAAVDNARGDAALNEMDKAGAELL